MEKITDSHAGVRNNAESFPGGSVVKNLPDNAGDMGSIPGLSWSHMCATATGLVPQGVGAAAAAAGTPRARALQQGEAPQQEAHALRAESSPHSPQPEKSHTAAKTRHSQKRPNKNTWDKWKWNVTHQNLCTAAKITK